MKRRITAIIACLSLTAGLLMGCSAGNKVDESVYFAHDLVAEEDMEHSQMLEDSLLSVGNTARVQKAIAKAKRGEDVNLVYLGGSITQGIGAPDDMSCYAYLSYEDFKNSYGTGSNVHYYNSGISGTPSTLGLVRSEKDVLSYSPDIVFIEFAVNDATDNTSLQMYESLVRRILTSENEPAVILIFTRTKDGYSAQSYQQAIGLDYDLGMISVNDAVTGQIDRGEIEWSDYSSDSAHPNRNGHLLVASMIVHYFLHAYNTEYSTYEVPEDTQTAYGIPFVNPTNLSLTSQEVTAAGSFTSKTVNCFTYTDGMVHEAGAGNDPLTFTADFSKLVISYEQFDDENHGDLEIYVDGELKATLHGSDEDAWSNIVTDVIMNEGESASHTVSLQMSGDTADKEFVLIDMIICE